MLEVVVEDEDGAGVNPGVAINNEAAGEAEEQDEVNKVADKLVAKMVSSEAELAEAEVEVGVADAAGEVAGLVIPTPML